MVYILRSRVSAVVPNLGLVFCPDSYLKLVYLLLININSYLMKKKIILTEEKITNKAYEEQHINLKDFEKNLTISILSSSEDKLEL